MPDVKGLKQTYQRRAHRGGWWSAVWLNTSCSDLHSAREPPPGSSSDDSEFAGNQKHQNWLFYRVCVSSYLQNYYRCDISYWWRVCGRQDGHWCSDGGFVTSSCRVWTLKINTNLWRFKPVELWDSLLTAGGAAYFSLVHMMWCYTFRQKQSKTVQKHSSCSLVPINP